MKKVTNEMIQENILNSLYNLLSELKADSKNNESILQEKSFISLLNIYNNNVENWINPFFSYTENQRNNLIIKNIKESKTSINFKNYILDLADANGGGVAVTSGAWLVYFNNYYDADFIKLDHKAAPDAINPLIKKREQIEAAGVTFKLNLNYILNEFNFTNEIILNDENNNQIILHKNNFIAMLAAAGARCYDALELYKIKNHVYCYINYKMCVFCAV